MTEKLSPQRRYPTRTAPEAGDASPCPSPPPPPPLLEPTHGRRRHSRSTKVFRAFRNAFRSFPILTPACRLPAGAGSGGGTHDGHMHGAVRMTGTLFGHRKARISLAIQENPRSLPVLLLELAIPTAKLLQEMGSGLVRIAMECEKKAADKTKLLEEPLWTMYCNGRKTGYGTRRDPTEADLNVMQLLHAVSMGAGPRTPPSRGALTAWHPNGHRSA
ncbi:hypothetical protein Taro_055391 [Colocasia esculenta]|uniref:Protein MIZU-KUSSEI 1 n=1 Tax=Colocasia esculenta TaxID=4460 RepID=A0A843XTH6_COLES|nr:hypothetical protein [Colocasia esculenta]